MSPCPSELELAKHVDGAGSSVVIDHLDACPSCQRAAAALMRARRTPESLTSGELSTAMKLVGTARERSPATQMGRYLLLERLGAGGVGAVYAAYDPVLNRKVALKILHDSSASQRLVREAQAMARLAHPNVVTVHDVGLVENDAFFTMELVEGETLRAWQSRRPSKLGLWRAYLEAGRGLSAAHAAGLIHGDFKPDNVLIGSDGRARVTDFGFMRLASSLADAQGGTPAYMAPERLQNGPADLRSDVYSFCASLREALALKKAPAWLAQGLRADPAQRTPSLEPILNALERRLRPRRWARELGIALVAVGVVAAFALGSNRHEAPCEAAGVQLTQQVWNGSSREAVERALLATQLSYAADTGKRVRERLDRHAEELSAAWRDACQATHVRHVQSPELLDQRLACLRQRATELGTLVDTLAHADSSTVEHATAAAANLTLASTCDDEVPGQAPVEPSAAWALEPEVARLKSLFDLGRYGEGATLAAGVVSQARQVGYGPQLAKALSLAGKLYSRTGDWTRAESDLWEAVSVAETSRADVEKATAWVRLTELLGSRRQRFSEAEHALLMARAAVQRVPARPDLQARLRIAEAAMAYSTGHPDQAVDAFKAAIDLLTRLNGEDDPTVLLLLSDEGAALAMGKHFDEALALQRRVLESATRALGPRHPSVVTDLNNLGAALLDRGTPDEARPYLERALTETESTLGARSPFVVSPLINLTDLERLAGRLALAEAYSVRAVELSRQTWGPMNVRTASALGARGRLLLAAHHPAEARKALTEAIDVREKLMGAQNPGLATDVETLGEAALEQGQRQAAVSLLQRAMALGSEDPELQSQASRALARAQTASGFPTHSGRPPHGRP